MILEVYKEGTLQRRQTYEQDVVKIGSHSMSHLFIDDRAVGRVHAVIEKKGDDVFVVDLGSKTGTLLNGERVRTHVLRQRDSITLGEHEIVVFLQPEAGHTDPVSAPEPKPEPVQTLPEPEKAVEFNCGTCRYYRKDKEASIERCVWGMPQRGTVTTAEGKTCGKHEPIKFGTCATCLYAYPYESRTDEPHVTCRRRAPHPGGWAVIPMTASCGEYYPKKVEEGS